MLAFVKLQVNWHPIRMSKSMEPNYIYDDLLHQNGWQSWVLNDEVYFTFEDLILLSDLVNEDWRFANTETTFKTWNDLLFEYRKLTGKEFKPALPISDEETYRTELKQSA